MNLTTLIGNRLVDSSVTLAKLGSDVGKCRAWVNFNGTGTVAINAALNVSSITDNGVGKYQVNFTSSLPDSAYYFGGNASFASGYEAYGLSIDEADTTPMTASACKVTAKRGGTSATIDPVYVFASFSHQ